MDWVAWSVAVKQFRVYGGWSYWAKVQKQCINRYVGFKRERCVWSLFADRAKQKIDRQLSAKGDGVWVRWAKRKRAMSSNRLRSYRVRTLQPNNRVSLANWWQWGEVRKESVRCKVAVYIKYHSDPWWRWAEVRRNGMRLRVVGNGVARANVWDLWSRFESRKLRKFIRRGGWDDWSSRKAKTYGRQCERLDSVS